MFPCQRKLVLRFAQLLSFPLTANISLSKMRKSTRLAEKLQKRILKEKLKKHYFNQKEYEQKSQPEQQQQQQQQQQQPKPKPNYRKSYKEQCYDLNLEIILLKNNIQNYCVLLHKHQLLVEKQKNQLYVLREESLKGDFLKKLDLIEAAKKNI
jgi:hypothetical protein